MIEFCNVNLKYHYDTYPLFCDLSFVLPDGTCTLLCDVQSGKTSLCRLVLGEIKPDSGQIVVDGVTVGRDTLPSMRVLYLPEKPVFFLNKSVLFNLQYPLKVRKILKENEQNLQQIVQQFGLYELLKTKVKALSPEQQKTLAIARGLTVARDIVLFDGFFDNNSDAEQMEQTLELFPCKQRVIVTAKPQLAVGHTVVLDNKQCAFCGDAPSAQQYVSELEWLAERI